MQAGEAADLARYVAANDPEAFRGIFMAHKDLVFAAARRILRDPADAEDVAQECFLEFTQKAAELKPPLAGWLHRLAVQRSINIVRNKASRLKREQTYAKSRPPAKECGWDD